VVGGETKGSRRLAHDDARGDAGGDGRLATLLRRRSGAYSAL
jgi:hypothetical protein